MTSLLCKMRLKFTCWLPRNKCRNADIVRSLLQPMISSSHSHLTRPRYPTQNFICQQLRKIMHALLSLPTSPTYAEEIPIHKLRVFTCYLRHSTDHLISSGKGSLNCIVIFFQASTFKTRWV